MTSYELRQDRDKFTTSVNKYMEKHDEILLKINEIDKMFEDSQDTTLIAFMRDVNNVIKSKISALDNDVIGYKNDTIVRVNEEINRLEYEEELERERLAKEQEENNV